MTITLPYRICFEVVAPEGGHSTKWLGAGSPVQLLGAQVGINLSSPCLRAGKGGDISDGWSEVGGVSGYCNGQRTTSPLRQIKSLRFLSRRYRSGGDKPALTTAFCWALFAKTGGATG